MIVWDCFDAESPNSRAHCQTCNQPILKGQPRVGQLSAWDRSPWMKYRHLACVTVDQCKTALYDAEDQVKQAAKILDLKLEMEVQKCLSTSNCKV
jgi:hypothetical protein